MCQVSEVGDTGALYEIDGFRCDRRAVGVEGSGTVLRLERFEQGDSLRLGPSWLLQGEWIEGRDRTKTGDQGFLKAKR